ncbi:MAG TPA: SDR family oxidoreductase [Paenibacillus sp.]|uniref:dTDP-4-dehydrorhamnose reductase family protein n=1 Tax=Paenibacillus sp. TaxID=58172 RepID=UPI0028D8492F|nr:SDR family oxidoreductase [Paenibacillus sp.]HUC94100.1 SDR family oxidoreductase [Paenibacillus sp.]
MKMLVIGGQGMAGHMLVRYFCRQESGVDVVYTVRRLAGAAADNERLLEAADFEAVLRMVKAERPDVIVNAAGVLNQDAEERPVAAYSVNGLLPHWLRHAADETGSRLIHISSDCVFSGSRGGYAETDRPDGTSVYARSKALGEVTDPRHLTIRTSIVGPEIRPAGIGLLYWFMRQKGPVKGYARVMWNGVTTLELAKAVEYAAANPQVGGLVHLTAPQPVSKLELLRLFAEVFDRRGVVIEPSEEPRIDRTLQATRSDWRYEAQPYRPMLEELARWMRPGGLHA